MDLTNADHVKTLQQVFAAANERRMAIVVHLRSSVTAKRPYGARSALAFLNDVLPLVPDVPVQIAHLAGSGGFDDPAIDEALGVFVDAIANRDPRMKNGYFGVSGVIGVEKPTAKLDLIARRIREIGVDRVLTARTEPSRLPTRRRRHGRPSGTCRSARPSSRSSRTTARPPWTAIAEHNRIESEGQ